jgi:hypothetical protein
MLSRKYRAIPVAFTEDTREAGVRREIDNFLLALHSYPERFANDPCLSFEDYLYSIMASERDLNGGPYRVN